MIAAMAEEAGLPFIELRHARDAAGQITGMIDQAQGQADILVSSGGVSGGTFDFVPSCVKSSGGEIIFHGLEMRPGKPLLFARLASGALYFGLPGNPVAALVGFRFFVLEAARAALGLPPEIGRELDRPASRSPGPTKFLRVRVSGEGECDSELDQRSHVLSSAAEADGWLRVDDVHGIDTLFPKRPGRLT
jgi:molybdopterin molybdotransferase